jgi:hypothetical protein
VMRSRRQKCLAPRVEFPATPGPIRNIGKQARYPGTEVGRNTWLRNPKDEPGPARSGSTRVWGACASRRASGGGRREGRELAQSLVEVTEGDLMVVDTGDDHIGTRQATAIVTATPTR